MIRDSITVNAPIERVWSALATPANLPRWNAHAIRVSGGDSVVHEGSQFWVHYRLGSRESDCHAEVTKLVPMSRLDIVVTGDRLDAGASVTEQYRLAPSGQGVRVTQQVHLGKSGMPWWAQILIAFIQTFGRPTGKRFLEEFKQQVESGELQ